MEHRNFRSLTPPILFLWPCGRSAGANYYRWRACIGCGCFVQRVFALSLLGRTNFPHQDDSPDLYGYSTVVATPNGFRLKAKVAANTIDVDLNGHFLIDYLRDFAAQYSLGPIWDTDSLRWRLNHAAQNRRRGKLVCRAVYGKATSPFGCYLYYRRPLGVADVLQLMTSPNRAGIVLDSLLEDAHQNRCVAVRGRTHSRYMDELLLHDCIFSGSPSVLLHSRNADIMEVACSGNALLIGLAGEDWSLVSMTFLTRWGNGPAAAQAARLLQRD